jgi:hypothetical protein
MLTPKKHMNLDSSMLRVSAIMLKELNKRGVIGFEQLRGIVNKKVGPNGDLIFIPALDFLFLLGKVEYHVRNDMIEYKAD